MNIQFSQKCTEANLCCAFCLDPYKDPQLINKCLHVFCKACITQVNLCPMCRVPFTAENLKHDFDKEERVEKIRNECLKINNRASQAGLPLSIESGVLKAIDEASTLLDRLPDGNEKWQGDNKLCLVKAAANPQTPASIIHR